MSTTENLSQKICRRCRSIYMGSSKELVCPTCQSSIKRAETRKELIRKHTEPLENPMMECLVSREGLTTVNVGGCRYTFEPNKKGHSVCKVSNPGHNKFLKKSGHYRAYTAEGQQMP